MADGAAPDFGFALNLRALLKGSQGKASWDCWISRRGKNRSATAGGVAILDEHIALLRHLEAAGADFLPTTIDSTHAAQPLSEAENGIKES